MTKDDMMPVVIASSAGDAIKQFGMLASTPTLQLFGFGFELFDASGERGNKTHLRFLICMRIKVLTARFAYRESGCVLQENDLSQVGLPEVSSRYQTSTFRQM
ncbi:hypothetical protein P608_25015 [Comamonas thiooxydans]|uniref:Uncharacterized protein n=1 Tax=Comamonas thiooxydans TaxID=363952 RepID=A0A0E3BTZ0_9BURK|nr:hypothetical protein P608_25015 [Comamonas thiooxydans]KGH17461.1 hypothetical protein P607_16925 [Comamonas thiooxydans]KGH18884.1 hypothetical protein P606_24130 [Comamonas thiooxydans]